MWLVGKSDMLNLHRMPKDKDRAEWGGLNAVGKKEMKISDEQHKILTTKLTTKMKQGMWRVGRKNR